MKINPQTFKIQIRIIIIYKQDNWIFMATMAPNKL